MDKKTLLAVALAILVMVSYSYIVQKFYPAPKEMPRPRTVSSAQPTVSSAQPTVSLIQPIALRGDLSTLSDENTRKVSTTNVDYELSDIGGCLKSINLKKYNGLEQKNPELIYSADFSRDAIFSISGLVSSCDLSSAQYKYSRLENAVEYSLILKDELEIKKIYNTNNTNGLELQINITNISGDPLKVRYSMVGVSDIKALTALDSRFIEGSISLNGKRNRIRPPRSASEPANIYLGNVDWVSLQNKYFSLVCKPYQTTVSSTVSKSPNNNIYIELQNDTVEINPGSTISHKYLLYSGPSNANLMASYQAGIENSIAPTTFGEISKLLLSMLNLFYKTSHNYGVAIILLAILVALILYPLTLKSYRSMKEIQILQPKVEKLRKEYKDNPQKLNKEIMELYKKHKVNPFGGCLPMLLQMPIFIALYQAFSRALELKGAGFLWIKDLSQPDRAFYLPLSSMMGSNLPVNILPILMAITMFLQQKISTPKHHDTVVDKGDTVQQQQKMMGILMPVMFGVIFYNMPSGLVLYWFVNTLIMLVQQLRIMKTFHVESASA